MQPIKIIDTRISNKIVKFFVVSSKKETAENGNEYHKLTLAHPHRNFQFEKNYFEEEVPPEMPMRKARVQLQQGDTIIRKDVWITLSECEFDAEDTALAVVEKAQKKPQEAM